MRSKSKEPLSVGISIPRFDAREKVMGKTKFAADYYTHDMLWAGVRRADVPHAVLKDIDCRDAERFPGVVKTLTYKDIPGLNRQGVIRRDQPVLVQDKIRHCGDAVAVVVAESREALEKAIGLIKIDYEPLPGVFDVERALEPDAPLVHEDNPGGNVLLKGSPAIGKGPEAEAECDAMVEASFQTQRQEHAYLETESGWAQYADGKLTIVCSTQTPFRDRMETAEVLALEPTDIRIIVPYVGGAFGGKDGITVQTLLGLAALNSNGRPVKMWWTREESFIASAKRHPAAMNYKLGCKADGTLHYLNAEIYLDTGPFDHLGGVVLALALEHAGGPYRIPNSVLNGWAVYTNNPISGAFRGFGVPQVSAAIEQMMDMLADKIGMDRLEFRLKNALHRGDKNCVGKTLTTSTGIGECLNAVKTHALWIDRNNWKACAGAFKRRGVGLAGLVHASGYGPVVPDVANAKIELTPEGRFRVYSGVVDMGQGNASSNIQIAGAILVQNSSNMELFLPDTDHTLPSGSASASRCTYTFGNALIGAAKLMKDRIRRRAADMLMAPDKDQVALIPGAVRDLRTGREIPLAKLAQFLDPSERIATHNFRAPVATDDLGFPDELRLHGLPHALYLIWSPPGLGGSGRDHRKHRCKGISGGHGCRRRDQSSNI